MEVFQILVVVAMVAFAVWRKSRQKEAMRTQLRKQQLQERLEAHLAMAPPPVPAEVRPKKKKEARKPAVQSVPPPSPARSAVHKAQDSSVKLHTPEEARRAFIYSEIFSRKYE